MNFTKSFKWQLVLVALGTSLMFTGKVYSQEIVNTEFPNAPASLGSNFNNPTAAAMYTAAIQQQTIPTPASAATQTSYQLNDLAAPEFALTFGPLLAIAILAIGWYVAAKVSANRRNNRKSNWKPYFTRNTSLPSRKPQILHS